MYDVIILGAGTAGMTAALYTNRAGLSTLIVEQELYGGQIINTPEIENYPALPGVSGFDFVQNLYQQAVEAFQTEFVFGTLTSFDFQGDVKKITIGDQTYESKTVIIASGAKHKKIGCAGEEAFQGKGVSYCATCDGAFFKGKEVAVVGGGNTALQDAKYLSRYCSRVYLIHRRDQFRAAQIEVEDALSRDNIMPVYDSVVEEIQGEQTVSSLKIKNVKNGTESILPVNGVFVAVGLNPQTELFRDSIAVDENGYFDAEEDCKTNLPGVFVAGDARRKPLRQLITAAADGAVSAEMAREYLDSRNEKEK